MAGAILAGDLAIVLRALVDVLDQHGDRRAGRHQRIAVTLGQYAGQEPHLVGLATLCDESRLPGPTPVELALDVGQRQADAGRAAVDHAAERRAVTLAPGGDAKKVAESVVRHRKGPSASQTAASPLACIGVSFEGQTADARFSFDTIGLILFSSRLPEAGPARRGNNNKEVDTCVP